MEGFLWALMNIVGPIVLLALLIWLVFFARKRRGAKDIEQTERATDELYDEEERRRREGTDDL